METLLPQVTLFWPVILGIAIAGIAYPLVVYPLVIRIAVARHASHQEESEDRSPVRSFTMIIPAHNEELVIGAKIDNTLKAAEASGYPYEIVVASDCSTDRTCEIARSFPAVKVLDIRQRGGIIGAFRAGLAATNGQIVIFSDADVTVERNSLGAMLRHFENGGVGGVCGCTLMHIREGSGLTIEEANVAARSWMRYRQSQLGSMIGADGSNWAVRRNLIALPTVAVIADDLVIPLEVLRQGYRFVYEPLARAFEVSPPTIQQEFERKVRTIAGGIQAAWRCSWMWARRYRRIGFHYFSWKLMKYAVGAWAGLASVAIVELAFRGSHICSAICVFGVAAVAPVALCAMLHFRIGGGMGRAVSGIWYLALMNVAPICACWYLVRRGRCATWAMAQRASEPLSTKAI